MSKTEVKPQKLRTLCKGCCFSEYEIDSLSYDQHQTGCMVGRLKQWQEKNKVETLDDGTFAIQGYCNKARHPKWLEFYQDTWEEQLAEELFPKVDVVIPVMNTYNIEEVRQTLVSLTVDKINNVVIVLKNSDIDPNVLVNLCSDLKLNRFFVTYYSAKTQNLHETINLGVHRLDGTFYAVLQPGHLWPGSVISSLNNYLNDDLKPFVLLKGDETHPTIIHRLSHIKLGGNTDEELISELIEKRLKEDEQTHLLVTWGEICNRR